METARKAKTEKSTLCSVKCEGFAHRFLPLQWRVRHEFVPQGCSVTKEYYHEVERRLREEILQKRTELWKNQSWIVHHDNAPAHTLMAVCKFLAKNKTVVMPQSPYSPDMAPTDIFLFPKLKTPMKGKRFATKNLNRSCWRYQKALFRSVLRIGKNAGISVLYVRGVTLMGTKLKILFDHTSFMLYKLTTNSRNYINIKEQ